MNNQESASCVDDAFYAALAAADLKARSRRGPGDPGLAAQVASFLHWEARLLDERRYRDWLDLLASDFVYWVPSSPEGGDPRARSAVNFDDRRRITDRVALLETGLFHAQTPPSRTVRVIGNVEAWPGDAGHIDVRSTLMISAHRRGHTNRFTAWQVHELVADADPWRIRRKVIHLVDCDEPQANIGFIL